MKKKLFIISYALLMGLILFSSSNVGKYGTVLEYVKCGTANGIPKPVPQMTSIAFTILIVGTPLVLIVFSIIALIKAISSGNADDVAKVKGKLLKKVIATAVIFLLAGIARFALNKVASNSSDKNSVSSCLSCFLYGTNCISSDSGNDVGYGNSHSDDSDIDLTPSTQTPSTTTPASSQTPTPTPTPNPTPAPTVPKEPVPINSTLRYAYTRSSTLSYGLFAPLSRPSNSVPLIIWLHGDGEKGASESTFNGSGAVSVFRNWNMSGFNAYILAPQLMSKVSWISQKANLEALINSICSNANYNIDKNRIILMGHSSGAVGVTDLASTSGSIKYSKLVIMSGYSSSNTNLNTIKNYPIKAYVGSASQDQVSYNFMTGTFKTTTGITPTTFNCNHGSVPSNALKQDLNNDGTSDLMAWILS